MYPKYHFLIGILFCGLLLLFFPNINTGGILLILVSTVLVDIDHYIYFVYKKKSLSLKRAYFWFKQIKLIWLRKSNKKEMYSYKWPVLFLHNIEFLLLTLILFFFYPSFGFLFIGLLLHFFLDFLDNLYYRFPLTTKFSLIYILIRNQNKKEFSF